MEPEPASRARGVVLRLAGRHIGTTADIGGRIPDAGRRPLGRPVAAVPGPDGAVYVTDDYAGAVYRVAPPGGTRNSQR